MSKKSKAEIEVYGAEINCASCVNAPSSKDTFEWLDAAIARKYALEDYVIQYIDIYEDIEDKRQKEIAEQVQNDDYFYPLVLIQGEVAGEGQISLKSVFAALEKIGLEEKNIDNQKE